MDASYVQQSSVFVYRRVDAKWHVSTLEVSAWRQQYFKVSQKVRNGFRCEPACERGWHRDDRLQVGTSRITGISTRTVKKLRRVQISICSLNGLTMTSGYLNL